MPSPIPCPKIRKIRETNQWRCLALAGIAVATLAMSGCARTPVGVTSQSTRQLVVRFTVRNRINLQRHYFFALDTTGEASAGPEPVLQPPWGNGWGAGRITWYVEIDDRQPGFFGLYRFNAGSNLLAPVYVGPPLTADAVQDTNQVQFTLDLDALKTPAGGTPTDINVNFIATDRIPLDPNDRTSKLVDALGDFGRGFVTLNTLGSRIFRNSDSSSPESAGDVADPDLDIVDWQIEVRNSSR